MLSPDQSVIIKDFNSEKMSVKEMAIKYNVKLNVLKSTIVRLQKHGLIGKKDKLGKVITSPINIYDKKKPGLKEMMESISNNTSVDENISTLHKEMLIEILHKIIVN